MRTIFKYRIPFKEDFEVDLPKGAEVIRVDVVDGFPFIWAVVDTDAPLVKRRFYARKTGSETPAVPDNVRYIGCAAIHVQMELMLYYFEPLSAAEDASPAATMPSTWRDLVLSEAFH